MPVTHILCQICNPLLQWSYPQLTHSCQHSLYSRIYSNAVTVWNVTEKALRMRCTVWCWDYKQPFLFQNLFTCIILFINMVGNSAGAAWKHNSRTLYMDTGWWITRFCSQFQNNFRYFKCLKHMSKKIFKFYIKHSAILSFGRHEFQNFHWNTTNVISFHTEETIKVNDHKQD